MRRALIAVAAAHAFPASQSPFSSAPAIQKGTLRCSVHIFDGVELTQYGQIVTAPYAPPPTGCADGALAVLEVRGGINAGRQYLSPRGYAVETGRGAAAAWDVDMPWRRVAATPRPGTWIFCGDDSRRRRGWGVESTGARLRYDRFGALWLGPVEILRTTTPEPNYDNAIAWSADRDLTEYSSLLLEPWNASISIPNTVDSTHASRAGKHEPNPLVPICRRRYTGVLSFNISISFYDAPVGVGTPASYVQAVLAPLANASVAPWDVIGVSGALSVTGAVTLPFRDAERVVVDLYASGHSCDEFWYANARRRRVLSSKRVVSSPPRFKTGRVVAASAADAHRRRTGPGPGHVGPLRPGQFPRTAGVYRRIPGRRRGAVPRHLLGRKQSAALAAARGHPVVRDPRVLRPSGTLAHWS